MREKIWFLGKQTNSTAHSVVLYSYMRLVSKQCKTVMRDFNDNSADAVESCNFSGKVKCSKLHLEHLQQMKQSTMLIFLQQEC